jgi:cation:H+ antiporter
MGGILGSCCFNVTIIVMLNAIIGGGSILRNVSGSHLLTSCFGLALTGLTLLWIVLAEKFEQRPAAGQTVEWLFSGIIALTYLGGMKLIYRYEHANHHTDATRAKEATGDVSLYVQLAILAGVLATSAWWLAKIGDVLGTHELEIIGRPLGATFVGALFLAIATSLPEIVTSIAAVRLGNLDMALGNILGSNMFNIFAVPILKIVSVSTGQSLLLAPSVCNGTQNLITGLLAILLTAIAVGGLTYKSKRKMLRRFGFDSVLIAVTYAAGMVVLLMGSN